MFDIPLRIGISGATPLARATAFQIKATPGMDLLWTTDDQAQSLLLNEAVDVFIDASSSTENGAQSALTALNNHTHVILTNPAVDLAIGTLLHATAYQNGLIVSSDAGTRHGALATLIQEAHIMGFDIVQAACLAHPDDPQLPLSLAALANAFAFLPPPGGLTGPNVSDLNEALTAFNFDSYQDTPRVDFLTGADGLYLIVAPKPDLPPEQADFLRQYHLGDGPRYLLHRPFHLRHLETPKSILAAAAGQAILAPGTPTCDVYAHARQDLPAGTPLTPSQLQGRLSPLNPDLVPIVLLENAPTLKLPLAQGQALTFDHLDLPDAPLTHLWIQQQELLS